MKTVSITKASRSLAEYAIALNGDIVVVTKDNQPLAALVPLRNIDRESWALSSHPEFRRLMAKARREIAKGKTLSLEELRMRALRPRTSSKRGKSAASRRRGG
jgi:antitoxin (DNA-binding transcriptional repressor) of toxin-antitoxin stability system